MDQRGKVANPARGQLNRENYIPLSPCVPENLISRDAFGSSVPRQPNHLHTQAGSGAYLRDSSRVPRRRPFMKPPYAIGSVPSLSGHAIAYRWRSLPRVRRHRASKPQGSSERVLPWPLFHGPINVRLSFPYPLLVWSGHAESTGEAQHSGSCNMICNIPRVETKGCLSCLVLSEG